MRKSFNRLEGEITVLHLLSLAMKLELANDAEREVLKRNLDMASTNFFSALYDPDRQKGVLACIKKIINDFDDEVRRSHLISLLKSLRLYAEVMKMIGFGDSESL
jgi:hypothetical protein